MKLGFISESGFYDPTKRFMYFNFFSYTNHGSHTLLVLFNGAKKEDFQHPIKASCKVIKCDIGYNRVQKHVYWIINKNQDRLIDRLHKIFGLAK